MFQPTAISATPPPSGTICTNSTLAPAALDTFQLFPRLPIELRVKIWKIASHEPRTVQVRFAKSCRIFKHCFITDIPAVLHTCMEARREALKYYKVSFQSRQSLNTTYFNFAVDILYMHTYEWEQAKSFVRNLPGKELIQRLAIPNSLVDYFSLLKSDGPGAKPAVFHFTGLKELFILKLLICLSTQACDICHSPMRFRNRDFFMSEEQVLMHGRKLIGHGNTYGQLDTLQHERQAVAVFRSDLQNKAWGAVLWEEPIITLGGVDMDTIPGANKYCNPYERKIHATRSSKRFT